LRERVSSLTLRQDQRAQFGTLPTMRIDQKIRISAPGVAKAWPGRAPPILAAATQAQWIAASRCLSIVSTSQKRCGIKDVMAGTTSPAITYRVVAINRCWDWELRF
jgi:hypothetical protein